MLSQADFFDDFESPVLEMHSSSDDTGAAEGEEPRAMDEAGEAPGES